MSCPEPKKSDKLDMFDVARGNCQLEEFLLTRFTPQELEKKIQVDPQAAFREYIAPPKPPRPVAPPKPLFPPPLGSAPAVPAAPEPADLQKLLDGFFQAAQDYTQRANWEDSPAEP